MGAITYKCPNCGGELTFDPALQKYKCAYCLSEFSQSELEALSPDEGKEMSPEPEEAYAEQEDKDSEGQAKIYSCPSCGAQIVTGPTTAATYCYYCHNPIVLEGQVSGEFLPDHIVPFQISREKAVETFRTYISRKKFVPKAFFDEQQIEKLTGIYYPFWLYECVLDGTVDGTGTKVRVYRMGDTEVTERNIYHVGRSGRIGFKGITRDALKDTARRLVENVQPFSLDGMKPFSMGYLSGFQAEKRDLEKDGFERELQQETEKYAKDLMQEDISGYSTVTLESSKFQVVQEDWQYIFLPVWVLTYAGKNNKIYYYAMNGQNGNVYGELPIDGKKLGLVSLIVFIAVTLLGLMGGYLI